MLEARTAALAPILGVAFLSGLLASCSLRSNRPSKPACRDTVVSGSVEHAETFTAEIGAGLTFRLDPATHPSNPQGWTIRVTPEGDPQADFSMVVTHPYRFSNPRYLDTGYGLTAEEAVAWTPRRFAFVGTLPDFETALHSLEVLLWPGEHSGREIARARSLHESLTTYDGVLKIIDATVIDPPDAVAHAQPRRVIGSLRFRVELCVPGEDP